MGQSRSHELTQPLELEVTLQMATREETRQRLDKQWEISRVKVFSKTLSLLLSPPVELPIGPNLDIVAENLSEHEIGLRHVPDPVTYLKLRFRTIHEICQWMKAFQIAKRPKWGADTDNCELCVRQFTFWRRRHHCRNCGHCVCGICSRDLAMLPHLGYVRPERVCADCATDLREAAASLLKQKMTYSQIIPSNAQPPPRRTSLPA